MDELIKYVESSFNMAAKDINNEPLPCFNGVSSRLKKGHYKIFVTPITFADLKDRFEYYVAMVQRVLDVYQKYLDGITFEIVYELYDSDCTIRWIKTGKKIWGQCYDEEINEYAKRKAISIGVIQPDTMEPVSENSVYHLILHEFGHFVGLGHSYVAKDVMAIIGDYSMELSENDIFVLKLLYSLPEKAMYSKYKHYILNEIEKFKEIKQDPECINLNLLEELNCLAENYKSNAILNVQKFPILNCLIERNYSDTYLYGR